MTTVHSIPSFMKTMGNLANQNKIPNKTLKQKAIAKAKRGKIIKQQRAKDNKKQSDAATKQSKADALTKKTLFKVINVAVKIRAQKLSKQAKLDEKALAKQAKLAGQAR